MAKFQQMVDFPFKHEFEFSLSQVQSNKKGLANLVITIMRSEKSLT